MKAAFSDKCIFDWKQDKILLQYDNEYNNWEISHEGVAEVSKHIG